jgi:hypothetical protein
MNRKQRKTILKKLTKKSFVDTSGKMMPTQLLNDISLLSMSPEEYARTVAKQLFESLKEEIVNDWSNQQQQMLAEDETTEYDIAAAEDDLV